MNAPRKQELDTQRDDATGENPAEIQERGLSIADLAELHRDLQRGKLRTHRKSKAQLRQIEAAEPKGHPLDRRGRRCFCTEPLRVEDGLVLCANEHVIALASALGEDVAKALDEVTGG